jgi:hypothetical protein
VGNRSSDRPKRRLNLIRALLGNCREEAVRAASMELESDLAPIIIPFAAARTFAEIADCSLNQNTALVWLRRSCPETTPLFWVVDSNTWRSWSCAQFISFSFIPAPFGGWRIPLLDPDALKVSPPFSASTPSRGICNEFHAFSCGVGASFSIYALFNTREIHCAGTGMFEDKTNWKLVLQAARGRSFG